MQIDRWTVDADEYSDGENNVNFSVWIDPVGQQHMSASYFSPEKAPTDKKNPVTPTPIPPRASAQAAEGVKVRPRYPHHPPHPPHSPSLRSYTLTQEEDVTRMPTLPQPILWQYDSAEYQAESSLSSLSLVVPELASKDKERRYVTPNPHPAIEDMKTTPPAKREKQQKVPQSQQKKSKQMRLPKSIDELDTVPPHAPTARSLSVPLPGKSRSLSTTRPPAPVVPVIEGDLRSWTAGGAARSLHAKRIASEDRERRSLRFNPLDQMRWWLLCPGRIEFLLWFTGTITLMTVTCIFLFVTVVSFGWISPGGGMRVGDSSSSLSTTTTGSVPCTAQTNQCSNTKTTGKSQMLFYPLAHGPIIAGMSISMQGKGFTPHANITFTHDGGVACQPASQQADAQGTFIVAMQLGIGAAWQPGNHVITAYDTNSKRAVRASITILPGTFGKSTTPTGTALPTTPGPGITPTASTGGNGGGNGGGQPGPLPTPVGQYPVTPTPGGVSPTPTPTRSVPTPTPTTGVQPTPTQPPKPTPTAGVGTTPTPGNTSVVSSQVTSLNAGATYRAVRTPTGLWLWLVLIGYALSMLMLGIAGVLHRRNHTQRTRS